MNIDYSQKLYIIILFVIITLILIPININQNKIGKNIALVLTIVVLMIGAFFINFILDKKDGEYFENNETDEHDDDDDDDDDDIDEDDNNDIEHHSNEKQKHENYKNMENYSNRKILPGNLLTSTISQNPSQQNRANNNVSVRMALGTI